MKKNLLFLLIPIFIIISCGNVPVKKFFLLNYEPTVLSNIGSIYPCTIRVKDFAVEQAYSKPQLVYRRSPYELQYYNYRVWAIKPSKMISNIVKKHLEVSKIVASVISRYDEGKIPDYELSGTLEAIEEYDSDQLWFAHLAIRFVLTRVSDNKVVYSRVFDNRKKVLVDKPEFVPEAVVKTLSQLTDYTISQLIIDMDNIFSKVYGKQGRNIHSVNDSLNYEKK